MLSQSKVYLKSILQSSLACDPPEAKNLAGYRALEKKRMFPDLSQYACNGRARAEVQGGYLMTLTTNSSKIWSEDRYWFCHQCLDHVQLNYHLTSVDCFLPFCTCSLHVPLFFLHFPLFFFLIFLFFLGWWNITNSHELQEYNPLHGAHGADGHSGDPHYAISVSEVPRS